MTNILRLLSAAGLALTIIPSVLAWYGYIPWLTHAQLMFAGMVLWFVTAPFWMNKED